VIPLVPLQLSLGAHARQNIRHRPPDSWSARWRLVGAGKSTVGAVASVTVKVVVQVALLVAASVAVTVIRASPIPPASGVGLGSK